MASYRSRYIPVQHDNSRSEERMERANKSYGLNYLGHKYKKMQNAMQKI